MILIVLFLNTKQQIPSHRLVYMVLGIAATLLIMIGHAPLIRILQGIKRENQMMRGTAIQLYFIMVAVCLLFSFDIVHVRGLYINGFRIFSNICVLYILLNLFYLVLGQIRVTTITVSVGAFIFNVLVYEVYVFRGIPFAPWDIFAIGTAADVAANYEIFFDEYMIYAWIIVMMVQQSSLLFTQKRKKTEYLPVGILVVLVACIYMTCVYPRLYGYLWDVNEAYIEEGLISGFVAHIPYAQYRKPKGYSDEKAKDILKNYEASHDEKTIKAKNIIVIMNESFADLSCLGTPLEYDYMPYYHGLDKNVVKGELVVPVYGGGTSNTEFEFLTGDTCSFNLQSPYETVIRGDVYSMIDTLKKQDFYCEAYHPGEPESWKRNQVYEWMGFENFDTNSQISPTENDMIGRFASDRFDYQQVISHFEARDKDKPYFLFNVTIQNHGGYDYDRAGLTISEEANAYHEYQDVEQYLSLIQESDKQLQGLISYFEQEKEPTIVCFFGDHLPALQSEFVENQQTDERNPYNKYVTPFLIWTNYDIEEKNIGKLSSNYAGSILLQEAGVELSDYDRFLLALYENYPIISSSEPGDDERIKEYEILEYYYLKKWRSG